MNGQRFLQIHTLTPYTATLLNRDDSGLAKRLPYGDAMRTRVSSQCLKRHWRIAEDPHSLSAIDGAVAATRSRELVTKRVIDPLRGRFSEEIVAALEPEFQTAVYGDKGTTKKSRQTLLFGEPELKWLKEEAERLVAGASDAQSVKARAAEWRREYRSNIKVMREGASLPEGLVTALFGRMVTSDPEANKTAAIHVAHAFTVHAEETESDYFTAVDDLSDDDPGADTIQETELTSGLFYGYVVVDIPQLLSNLGGQAGDMDFGGKVIHNLIYLIAEVSPGAKLGSTAPYGRASFMLLEAGNRQPRSLAEAYRTPCKPAAAPAIRMLAEHLAALDQAYATGEERRFLSLVDIEVPNAQRLSLTELADWAKSLPQCIAQ